MAVKTAMNRFFLLSKNSRKLSEVTEHKGFAFRCGMRPDAPLYADGRPASAPSFFSGRGAPKIAL